MKSTNDFIAHSFFASLQCSHLLLQLQFTGDGDWKKWSSNSDGKNRDLPVSKQELTVTELLKGDIFETPDKGNQCDKRQAECHQNTLEEDNNGTNLEDEFSPKSITNYRQLGNPISTATIVGENAVVDSGVTIEIFQEGDSKAIEDHHDTDHTMVAENGRGEKKMSVSKNKTTNRNKDMVSAEKEHLERYNSHRESSLSRKKKTVYVKKIKKT